MTDRGTIAIAQRIAKLRKEREISQQQMAKKLGVTQPVTVDRYLPQPKILHPYPRDRFRARLAAAAV